MLDQNTENDKVSQSVDADKVSSCDEVSGAAIECNADIALDVIESAITDEKKLLYHAAYLSGAVLDDSMYTTWSMYKTQALNKSPTVHTPQVVPSNPLLTLSKQEFTKKIPRKKSQYFVISSDEAFREKVKVEKEQRQAESEERKKKRQLKQEHNESALRVKSEKTEQTDMYNVPLNQIMLVFTCHFIFVVVIRWINKAFYQYS